MDLASRWSGLELLLKIGEFKARSLARKLAFNLYVGKTWGVLKLYIKVAEGSGPLKTLRI